MTRASAHGSAHPQPIGDRDQFAVEADRHRRELLAHCYKMVGSLHEAEDLVQETYIRAWRGWDDFEGRSSVRTWLYRIATNLCLTAANPQRNKSLPSGLGGDEYSHLERRPGDGELTPFPTDGFGHGDPAQAAEARAGLRLALVTSLQYLPPRQRAAFILREALSYSAAEIADMLGMTVPAVKSALQRARAKLDSVQPSVDTVAEPADASARKALDEYMSAFENADIGLLRQLLTAEAVLTVHPDGPRLEGMAACIAYLAEHVLTQPGQYRMVPTWANGQPAAIAYRRDHAQAAYEPFGIGVLTIEGDQVVGIDAFVDASLVALFDALSPPAQT